MRLKVIYNRRFPEWHERSSPVVVNSNREIFCTVPQFVGHPGEYDKKAEARAHLIVFAVNNYLNDHPDVSLDSLSLE